MIEFNLCGMPVKVSPLFFSVLTLFLLIDNNNIALIAVLAAACHETGHILAMLISGERPKTLMLTAFGVRMERDGATLSGYYHDAIIWAAGPAVNFLLAAVLMGLGMSTAAWINIAVGGFNLLPSGRLDGGNLLRLWMEYKQVKSRRAIIAAVNFAVLAPIVLLGIYFAVFRGNATLLLSSGYLLSAVIFDRA